MIPYPYVITVSSEKGGVGKTTLATNLAIFLKALDENLPVSILSFDNHYTVDRMFEFKGRPVTGDVAGLLLGTPGGDLLHTGQYGVDYIPSANSLSELKHSISGTLELARMLANSRIPGILIIDTRPDLDVLTQNALFAADKVIIPVKDMASLENCRNIFDLFERKGFDRKSLSLIPCLIDSRIKFEGTFRDQRSLLKAYAINRGYRCLDTYISKSPKVESLGTNPSGRVYPILSYARNTEVYSQFVQLAGTVLEEFRATSAPRSCLYRQWLDAEEERKNSELADRRAGLRSDCLFCGRPVLHRESDGALGYYFETSNGAARGFLEDECFSRLLVSSLLNVGKDVSPGDPVYRMLQEAARGSSFVFRPAANGSGPMVEVIRFDARGSLVSRKLHPLAEYEGGILRRERSRLHILMSETLADFEGKREEAFLLVHQVDNQEPENILKEENYRGFCKLKNRVFEQLEQAVAS